MTWSVVVPTCRPEQYAEFEKAWKPLFEKHDVAVHVIRDPLPDDAAPYWIPRHTDMCRSWGIYQAWYSGSDYTLTLDDDVRPDGDVFAAYEHVFQAGTTVSGFLNVGEFTTYRGPLRGYPVKDRERREVAVQYGGWHGVLDYDAPTQLQGVSTDESFADVVVTVPRGAAVTGCIMNAAWRTRYAPIMWQLPMLDGRYNRFGDIWSGLFAKRVCDTLGVGMVVNGRASVRHERASDPEKNLEREQPGIPVNEGLWDAVYAGRTEDMAKAYLRVTDTAAAYFRRHDPEYAEHFKQSRDEWLRLFQ